MFLSKCCANCDYNKRKLGKNKILCCNAIRAYRNPVMNIDDCCSYYKSISLFDRIKQWLRI